MTLLSRIKRRWLPLGLAAATALLVACGGGGDDDDDQPIPAPTRTLRGVAATGAAFTDAVVRVHAADGSVAGTSEPVGRDGMWQVTLAEGAKAPFVIVASRPRASGETEMLVSLLVSAPEGNTYVNVTPLTTVVAARISPSGQPDKLVDELKVGSATVDSQAIAARSGEVKELLAAALRATGTTALDPFTSPLTVGATGHDQLLDTILVVITPSGENRSNIDLGVKAGAGSEPINITLRSDQPMASIRTENADALGRVIDPGALPPVGLATLIDDMFQRLNACYALPTASRVSGVNAASVAAPACRTLFVGDDPTRYLSNGSVVSSTASFSSLFRDSATNLRFSQGSYEFTRVNGDLVIAYRAVAADGGESYDTFVVRNEAGKLKLAGNQYLYSGGVAPYHEHRMFPTLNQSAFTYYNTGYNLNVNNVTSNGVPIFDRVVVTTPNGRTITLRPSAGSAYLPIARANGSVSGTSAFMMGARFADSATPGTPPAKDTSLVFDSPLWTDEQIRVIPAQQVWKFTYYLAANPNAIAAEQNYRTRRRALTIEELMVKPLARLTSSSLTALTANPNAQGRIPMTAGQPVNVAWEVPTSPRAVSPTQLMVFGTYTANNTQQSFNDSVNVSSNARSGVVTCSQATAVDQHCNGSNFGSNNVQNGLHLYGIDSDGRGFSVHYSTYPLQ